MLVGGTTIVQIINVASSPLITRVYGPESFGILGIFLSLVSILVPLSSFGYDYAIVIPKHGNEGSALVKLSTLLAVAFALLLLVVLSFGSQSVAVHVGLHNHSDYLLLVPIAVLLGSLSQILTKWCIREKKFRLISLSSVYQVVLVVSLKLAVGILWPKAITLVLATLGGSGLRVALLKSGIGKGRVSVAHSLTTRHYNLRSTAKKYKDFPLFQVPTTLAGRVGDAAPVIVVAAILGPMSAGFFALARRMVALPSILVAESIGKVYRSSAAQALQQGESLVAKLKTVTLGLVAFGLLPYGIIILWGPALFGFVFGNEWDSAGHLARWLALWYLVHIAAGPASESLLLTRRLQLRLLYAWIANGLKIGSIIIAARVSQDVLFTVIVFAVVGIINDIVLVVIAITLLKRGDTFSRRTNSEQENEQSIS